MVWARIDDAILDNPKILRAGPVGFALHVAAITWCARNLSDGFVPKHKAKQLLGTCWNVAAPTDEAPERQTIWSLGAVSGFAGMDGDEVYTQVIDVLVEVGLWEEGTDDRGNFGYWVHDYLDYNPSRAEVLEEREKKRAAGVAGGKATAARRQARGQADAATHAAAHAQAEGLAKRQHKGQQNSTPVPDPVPVPKEEERGAQAPRKRASALREDWEPDERDVAFTREQAWSAEKAGGEAAKFKAHHLAKGSLMKDWHQAWRTWVLKERSFRQPTAPRSGRFPSSPPANSTGVTYRDFPPDDPKVVPIDSTKQADFAAKLALLGKGGNAG